VFNHVGGKPPFFDGVSSFAHWKRKMTMYLGSIYERVLQVIENDFAIIDPDHLTDEDRANRTCNRMALNTLYNGIDTKVFEGIKDLELANEVWTRLSEIYEGTKVVKSAKLYGLKSEFENFKMKEEETILEMFHRLQVIVNDLKSLGHKTQDQDFWHKFLLSLPRRFKMLIMMLQRDGLDAMKSNDLLGEVLTYDKYDQDADEKEKKEKEKKKKTMAFKAISSKGKAIIIEEKEEDNNEGEDFEIDDDALALIVKRMGHMFIKKRGFKKRNDNLKSNEQQRKCFNCDSTEHLQAECPYDKKKKNKRVKFEKKKREAKITFKKGKNEAYVVTWESEEEEEESSNKAFASIAINKKPSLFGSSSSCFMAKEAKVLYDESDDESEMEYVHDSNNDNDNDNDNENKDDEPTKEQLYDLMQQTREIAVAKDKECKKLSMKVAILEKVLSELKTTHESLVEDHENLGKAHSKLEKEHSLLLEQQAKEIIISCDIGVTCDIIDESSYELIIISNANPSCSSSSTTTDSTSSTSDGFTCDASLMVENETLKREVDELTYALGKAYGSEACLFKCLGSQRFSLNKEGLGYNPKKGKSAFATPKPSFMKGNGRFCNRCKQVGHLEHNYNKKN
jgi:hypothetical protein